MSAIHSAQLLLRLQTFMRSGPEGFSAEDAEAVDRNIGAYFGRCLGLDEAFGVKLDRGENHPGRDLRYAVRDAELCAAAALLASGDDRSKTLAAKFSRYFADAWPKERGLDACPPARVGQIEGHFWAALRIHPALIGKRRIEVILAAQQELKSAFDFHGRVDTGKCEFGN
jgi:hypothetical protein